MKLTEHCYAVTGLGFTPPWEVNAGFVVGTRRTLVVDTGPTAHAARTIHGYATAARPGNELLAVNSELHVDHLLGNSVFRDLGVPLHGHPRCRREEDALALNALEYGATIPDPERRARDEAQLFFAGSRIVNPEHDIAEETRFDLGGVTVVAIPAPGHTPANLLLHVPEDDLLFAGDTVVAGYHPNLEGGGREAWRQWLLALAFVRALAPRVLVPGHGSVLAGAEIEREITRVERVLQDALGAP